MSIAPEFWLEWSFWLVTSLVIAIIAGLQWRQSPQILFVGCDSKYIARKYIFISCSVSLLGIVLTIPVVVTNLDIHRRALIISTDIASYFVIKASYQTCLWLRNAFLPYLSDEPSLKKFSQSRQLLHSFGRDLKPFVVLNSLLLLCHSVTMCVFGKDIYNIILPFAFLIFACALLRTLRIFHFFQSIADDHLQNFMQLRRAKLLRARKRFKTSRDEKKKWLKTALGKEYIRRTKLPEIARLYFRILATSIALVIIVFSVEMILIIFNVFANGIEIESIVYRPVKDETQYEFLFVLWLLFLCPLIFNVALMRVFWTPIACSAQSHPTVVSQIKEQIETIDSSESISIASIESNNADDIGNISLQMA